MKIYDFKTNNKISPINVYSNPKFSWKSDFKQTAYRIIVSSENEIFYDSKTVKSKENIGIIYKGKKLVSDRHYDVKLTVYNGKETCSINDGFDTALLDDSEWKGCWTGLTGNFTGGTFCLRCELKDMPKKKIARARCYVAGLGYHEFYANGNKIGKAYLSPAISDLTKRVYYSTYDLTDKLNENYNVLGFILGNGFLGQKQYLFQLNVNYEDGTTYQAFSGKNHVWLTPFAITENSVYGGETYDANKEIEHWCDNKIDAYWTNGWMYTTRSILPPSGRLVSSEIEDVEICDEYNVVSAKTMADGSVVYDFGQNLAGWCKIKVVGEKYGKVKILYGEDIKDDGSVNRLNLRLADCKDEYILNGKETEEYNPRFTYRGFRYAQVYVEGRVEIKEIIAQHVHTAVKTVGNFECSDETLNKLHKMSAITELNNLHGILTDCPQRDERFMWLNDLSSRIFETVNNYGMENMFPKILDDISDTGDKKGRIADTAPYFVGQQPADPVCVCYLLFALRCYEWYGDIQTLKKHYKKLKGWTDFLINNSSSYIMDYFYYGDWVLPFYEDKKYTDNLFVSSSYLFWHIVSMKKIAKICGRKKDYEYYSNAEKQAKISFNNKFYNAKEKYYDSNTQTANAIALSLGLAPVEDRKEIARHVLDDIKERNYHSTCGNQGYRHLFYAMTEEGYIDDLIKMIKNPEYPGWGYMVKCGATTVWERWEKEMQCEMNSFDHPMFGAYDGWLYEYLGGIKIADDSFGANKINIKPYIAKEIDYVNCSIDTVRGKVVSNWKKQNDKVNYHIEIPLGIEACVEIDNKEIKLFCGKYDFQGVIYDK